MQAIKNATRQVYTLPGLIHRTIASKEDGLARLECWMQTMEPHSETPLHYHECEEIVVVLKGFGELILPDEVTGFGPDSTLVINPRQVHQLINTEDEELSLIAALSETPARVFDPDGTLMDLPWS